MQNQMLYLENLIDFEQTVCRDLLREKQFPWEVVPCIREYIMTLGKTLINGFSQIKENVWVSNSTLVEPTAMIKGPAIIGHNCEVRHGACIRENVIVGNDVVIGNSTELKNSIVLNGVKIPHYNYIGDSILGYKAHLGAGAIISNVKSIQGSILIKDPEGNVMDTGLRKFGAVLGDFAEIGSNSVLNPGTIVGRRSIVYPLIAARGVILPDTIVKSEKEIVKRV